MSKESGPRRIAPVYRNVKEKASREHHTILAAAYLGGSPQNPDGTRDDIQPRVSSKISFERECDACKCVTPSCPVAQMRTCALSRPRWELKLWVQSKYERPRPARTTRISNGHDFELISSRHRSAPALRPTKTQGSPSETSESTEMRSDASSDSSVASSSVEASSAQFHQQAQ